MEFIQLPMLSISQNSNKQKNNQNIKPELEKNQQNYHKERHTQNDLRNSFDFNKDAILMQEQISYQSNSFVNKNLENQESVLSKIKFDQEFFQSNLINRDNEISLQELENSKIMLNLKQPVQSYKQMSQEPIEARKKERERRYSQNNSKNITKNLLPLNVQNSQSQRQSLQISSINSSHIYLQPYSGENLQFLIKKIEKDGGILVYDCYSSQKLQMKDNQHLELKRKIFDFVETCKQKQFKSVAFRSEQWKGVQQNQQQQKQQQQVQQQDVQQEQLIFSGFQGEQIQKGELQQKRGVGMQKQNSRVNSLFQQGVLEGLSEKERQNFQNLRNFPSVRPYPQISELRLEVDLESVFFDSRFESGNLRRAYKVGVNEYNLICDFDSSTDYYTQWFFFRVSNVQQDLKVKFNLVNLYKDKSLYDKGMKPCIFSEKKYEQTGEKWHRAGEYVTYQKNENFKKSNLCPQLVQLSNMNGKKPDFIQQIQQQQQPGATLSQAQNKKPQKIISVSSNNQNNNNYNFAERAAAGASNNSNKTQNFLFYYTISFVYTFKYAFDTVYFANCFPYTYTDLQNFLANQKKIHSHKNILQLEQMCQTPIGNKIQILTITQETQVENPFQKNKSDQTKNTKNNHETDSETTKLTHEKQNQFQTKNNNEIQSSESPQEAQIYKNWLAMNQSNLNLLQIQNPQKNPNTQQNYQQTVQSNQKEQNQQKPIVLLTSRVHPGESNASYIMEGMIKFLLSEDKRARFLREKFIFKIVPMLNPDGVRYGNYRCDLFGYDLNRKWKSPVEGVHNSIFYLKKLVEFWRDSQKEVYFFCDIHGHSKKNDIFMYGNNFRESEGSSAALNELLGGFECLSNIQKEQNTQARIFPFLFDQRIPYFSYPKTSFQIQKAKLGTGRCVLFLESQIIRSYTLECSFFGHKEKMDAPIGSSNNQQQGNNFVVLEFGQDFLKSVGQEFLITLYVMQQKEIYTAVSDIFNYKSHMTYLGMSKEFAAKIKPEKIFTVTKKNLRNPSTKAFTPPLNQNQNQNQNLDYDQNLDNLKQNQNQDNLKQNPLLNRPFSPAQNQSPSLNSQTVKSPSNSSSFKNLNRINSSRSKATDNSLIAQNKFITEEEIKIHQSCNFKNQKEQTLAETEKINSLKNKNQPNFKLPEINFNNNSNQNTNKLFVLPKQIHFDNLQSIENNNNAPLHQKLSLNEENQKDLVQIKKFIYQEQNENNTRQYNFLNAKQEIIRQKKAVKQYNLHQKFKKYMETHQNNQKILLTRENTNSENLIQDAISNYTNLQNNIIQYSSHVIKYSTKNTNDLPPENTNSYLNNTEKNEQLKKTRYSTPVTNKKKEPYNLNQINQRIKDLNEGLLIRGNTNQNY